MKKKCENNDYAFTNRWGGQSNWILFKEKRASENNREKEKKKTKVQKERLKGNDKKH